MKQKIFNYVSPQVRVVKVEVEKGFAASKTGTAPDSWLHGEDW